jgi:hypothetical protein
MMSGDMREELIRSAAIFVQIVTDVTVQAIDKLGVGLKMLARLSTTLIYLYFYFWQLWRVIFFI